jgi:hypothetical protein
MTAKHLRAGACLHQLQITGLSEKHEPEPLRFHGITPNLAETRNRIDELLGAIGLNPKMAERYPHNSPADSASASRSPAPSRSGPSSSSPTSRSRRST